MLRPHAHQPSYARLAPAPAVAGAAALEALVQSLRGIGDPRVDLVSVSTGGQIVRYWLAYGGRDALEGAAPSGDGAAMTRRVVYVGAPHRGSFDALACLHRGF